MSKMIDAKRFGAASCLAVAGVLLAGCGGGGGPAATGGSRRFGSLVFSLATPKPAYTRGESVPLTFTVRNVGLQTVTARGSGCIVLYAVTQAGRDISPGFECSGATFDLTLAPGEMKTYSMQWDQRDDAGNIVQPGLDTITAWLTTANVNGTTMSVADTEVNLAANPVQVEVTD